MKKVLYILLLIVFSMIALNGCAKNNILKIDNFKHFNSELIYDKNNEHSQALNGKNKLFYFKNFSQYEEFINDKNIFKPTLSDNFKKFNLKYNDEYFKKHDLILCQIGVSGSHTKIYYSLTNNSETNVLHLEVRKKNNRKIDDCGMYYDMNYLTVQKYVNAKKIIVSILGHKEGTDLEYIIK